MAKYFEILTHNLLEKPNQDIFNIKLVDHDQYKFLQTTQNNQSVSTTSCLHELIENQAHQFSNKTAIVFEKESLTFWQLNASANKLARSLIDKAGPLNNEIIAILLPKGPKFIVSILAILKTGAAYLPLDIKYPKDRIDYVINDAKPKILITCDRDTFKNKLSVVECISILDDRSKLKHNEYQNLDIEVLPTDRAYVIYTSGSTGEPKGVEVEHTNVTGLFAASKKQFEFNANDVWTLFHSCSFDFSVWEIFGALIYGGQLIIVSDELARDPRSFTKMLIDSKVTVLNQTPTAFYNLIPFALEQIDKYSLKHVIFGGEALEPRKLKIWTDKFGIAKPHLVNMYGITETTVHVTFKKISMSEINLGISNIGKPLPGLELYVLDKYGNLLPEGVPGELYVSGYGVTRGYLNRPELTSDRYIKNELLSKNRLYRTGDIVRKLTNNEYEYRGRIDNQVKIRGYRIELGEIEFILNSIGQVSASIVIPYEQSGIKKLTAFCLIENIDNGISGENLHRQLQEMLPLHMIPAPIIPVKEFPITNNGKIDKKALLRQLPEFQPTTYTAPETELEVRLVKIYKKVLNSDVIGIDDNYFALGGDSIRIVQILSEAAKNSIQIKVHDIFTHQTIRELAAYLALNLNTKDLEIPLQLADAPKDFVLQKGDEDAYVLTPTQELMIKLHNKEVATSIYQPQMLYIIENEKLNKNLLTEVVSYLMTKHPALRTRFQCLPTGQYVQILSSEMKPMVNYFDFSNTDEHKIKNIILKKVQKEGLKRFDLTDKFSKMRYFLFKLPNKKYGLLTLAHHIIEDGWGIIEFKKELFSLLESRLLNKKFPKISAKANTFREHIALTMEMANSKKSQQAWSTILSGLAPMNPIKQRGSHSFNNQFQHFNIPSEDMLKLKDVKKNKGNSIKSLFLFAFQLSIAKEYKLKNVIIDVVSNGRSSRLSDPFNALGLFWSFLPIPIPKQTEETHKALNELNKNLNTAEEHNLFPASKLLDNEKPYLVTWASFNLVNFHNLEVPQQAKRGMKHEMVYSRDDFHHPLKLTVSLTNKQAGANLCIEYCGSVFSKSEINSLIYRIKENVLQMI